MEQEKILQESESANEELMPEPTADASCADKAQELENLRGDLADITDKYMRAAAEIENMRRRATIDAENMARARAVSVAEKFLPIVDATAAALSHDPENQGLLLLVRATDSALVKIGITRIESIGRTMNPQFHNVVSVRESDFSANPDADRLAAGAPTAPNTVLEELQPGYMFGDTVLRPAMVVVAK
ncbi:MAG: nucleotide exchange factor GrpE [Rickettsiales bacterium]|nr:nucleotide exchange factor GrpE [Rickettsiales bacterium]